MCLLLRMNFLKNCLKIVKKKKNCLLQYMGLSPEILKFQPFPQVLTIQLLYLFLWLALKFKQKKQKQLLPPLSVNLKLLVVSSKSLWWVCRRV